MKARRTFRALAKGEKARKKLLNFTGPEKPMAEGEKKPEPEELSKAAAWAKLSEEPVVDNTPQLREQTIRELAQLTPEEYQKEMQAITQQYLAQGYSLPAAREAMRTSYGTQNDYQRARKSVETAERASMPIHGGTPFEMAAENMGANDLVQTAAGLPAGFLADDYAMRGISTLKRRAALKAFTDRAATGSANRLGVRNALRLAPTAQRSGGGVARGVVQARNAAKGTQGANALTRAAKAPGNLLKTPFRALKNPGNIMRGAGAMAAVNELANARGTGGLLYTLATGKETDAYRDGINNIVDQRVVNNEAPTGFWGGLRDAVGGLATAGADPWVRAGTLGFLGADDIGNAITGRDNRSAGQEALERGYLAIGNRMPWNTRVDTNSAYVNKAQNMAQDFVGNQKQELAGHYDRNSDATMRGSGGDMEGLRNWYASNNVGVDADNIGAGWQSMMEANNTTDYRDNKPGEFGGTYLDTLKGMKDQSDWDAQDALYGVSGSGPGNPLRNYRRSLNSMAQDGDPNSTSTSGYNPYTNNFKQMFSDEEFDRFLGDKTDAMASSRAAQQLRRDVERGALSQDQMASFLANHTPHQLQKLYGGWDLSQYSDATTLPEQIAEVNQRRAPIFNAVARYEDHATDWDQIAQYANDARTQQAQPAAPVQQPAAPVQQQPAPVQQQPAPAQQPAARQPAESPRADVAQRPDPQAARKPTTGQPPPRPQNAQAWGA